MLRIFCQNLPDISCNTPSQFIMGADHITSAGNGFLDDEIFTSSAEDVVNMCGSLGDVCLERKHIHVGIVFFLAYIPKHINDLENMSLTVVPAVGTVLPMVDNMPTVKIGFSMQSLVSRTLVTRISPLVVVVLGMSSTTVYSEAHLPVSPCCNRKSVLFRLKLTSTDKKYKT